MAVSCSYSRRDIRGDTEAAFLQQSSSLGLHLASCPFLPLSPSQRSTLDDPQQCPCIWSWQMGYLCLQNYCVDAIYRSLFLCLGVKNMWCPGARGAVTLGEKSLTQHPRAAPALLTPVLSSLLLPSENGH